MMKIRILHIIPNLNTGGAERLVVNLLEAIDKEKFEVAVCSLYDKSSSPFEEHLEKNGIPIYYLGKRKGLDLRMITRLYRLFKFFKPDVAHTHLSVQRYALIPQVLCGIPIKLHTVHNIAQKEVDVPGKIVHWLAFHVVGVVPVSISQVVARTVKDVYNIATPIIYNGIPTMQFSGMNEMRNFWREKEGIADSEVIFLHIGRFSAQKNHCLLIEAFEQVIKGRDGLKLFLVGDGELRIKIELLVKEKRLEHCVNFLGLRQDIPELLAACDVFALSSDYEGLPMVILEAMAAGKPVISTAVGGISELVESGVTGILVPSRDPKSLAQAMIQLANDYPLRETMSKRSQKYALERFDISLIVRQYEKFYLKAMEARLQ